MTETADDIQIKETTTIFPKAIIGIGGAGKKLVHSLLNKEWILEKMLKPRMKGVSNYDIFIVDTAKYEEDDDLRTHADIIDKKDKIRAKLQNTDYGIPKDLNIQYLLLTEAMHLNGPYDLMGPKIIKDIKMGTGIKYWWFDPDIIGKDLMIRLNGEENFDSLAFSGGVIRKRALGKAIFYKAISTKIFNIGLTSGGEVAMVVGLGGGTGSGIFIDYAKRLKEASPTIDITLFAVLPTQNEKDRERANGFASLCELEYLRLTGELRNLFKNIILLPMGLTEYSGDNKNKDIIDMMEEFHTAFAYTFVSCFNLGVNARLIQYQGDYEYAPFTVATSCVMRYNVETNKKIIYSYDYALKSKKDALIEEKGINSTLNIFLTDEDNKDGENINPELDTEYNLSIDDDTWLLKRMKDFNTLFFTEPIIKYFNSTGYNSVSTFYSAINNAQKKNSTSGTISSIRNDITVVADAMQNPRDVIDAPIKYVTCEEFSVMGDIARLFSRANKPKYNDSARDILKAIITKAEPAGSYMLTDDNKRELDATISNMKTGINKLADSYKNYKGIINTQILDTKGRILNDIRTDTEQLKIIKSGEYQEDLKNKLGRVDDVLTEYKDSVNKCKRVSELREISTERIKRVVDDFYLRVVIIDPKFDKDAILTAAEDIIKYKEYMIKSRRRLSIIDIILRLFGIKTDAVKEKEKAEEERRRLAININPGLIYATDDQNNITKVFYYDIDKKSEEREDIIMERIISMIDNRIKHDIVDTNKYQRDRVRLDTDIELNQDQRNRIKISIENNNMENILDDILKDIMKYNENIKAYEDQINNKSIELTNAEKTKRFSIDLDQLYRTLTTRIHAYRRNEDTKEKYMKSFEEYRSSSREQDRNPNRDHYVFDIKPKEILNVIQKDNIDILLRGEQIEENNLLAAVDNQINKLFNPNYNGLAKLSIGYENQGRWLVSSVVLCTSSLKDINIDKTKTIKENFNIDSSRIGYSLLKVGGNWDVGSTLFVSGIFLDNLIEVSKPVIGHYAAYRELKKRMDRLTFLYHTYLLENGEFLCRTLLSLEDDNNKKLLATGTPSQITGELLKLYKTASYIDQSKQQQQNSQLINSGSDNDTPRDNTNDNIGK